MYYDAVNNHTFSDIVAVDPAPAPNTDPTRWFLDSVRAADKVPTCL